MSAPSERITLVKKIAADGKPCRKCVDVLSRLRADGALERIHRIATALENDPQSEGARLAAEHGVDRAPFFIVEQESGETRVFTSYLRFKRHLLSAPADSRSDALELMEQHAGQLHLP